MGQGSKYWNAIGVQNKKINVENML